MRPDEPAFLLYFNRRRQFAKVYLWDAHPVTFYNWNETRWGYFLPTWKFIRSGEFGELHFVTSRLRVDTIYHELDHLRREWIWCARNEWTGRQEESLVCFMDKLYYEFIRQLSKIHPKSKKWIKTLYEL